MKYQPLEYLHATRSRLPRLREALTPIRIIYTLIVVSFFWLMASYIPASRQSLQKFYCFGPAMSPFEMTAKSYSTWHRGSESPIKFNTHVAVDVSNTSSIGYFNLNQVKSTRQAADNKERVLILSPLRDAASYLQKYFDLLAALTYPHDLIDLGFLISDTSDETLNALNTELDRVQSGPKPFNRVSIFSKSFGTSWDNSNVEERHDFEAQAPRRKAMARARNYLLTSALRPEHSWVMWRDVDIVEAPKSIIEDFIGHDKDIVVPNVWFHRFENGKDVEGRFDYNSWVESSKALELANTLSKDTVIVEGYKEFDTGRKYMCLMGDQHDSKKLHEELELDGVGGVNIVVKADVHRSGINFPAYAFENQCETEGFAKMAKRAGYSVVGLPNYIVWHVDTDEKKSKD